MRIASLLDRFSAVVLGSFNPAIFSPAWFALNKLVSVADADKPTNLIIHNQVCQFEIGELSIFCDQERFAVSCSTNVYEIAKDLVLSTFGGILPHTPIRGLGLNREVQFDCSSQTVRDAVGDILAPKAPWGLWAEDLLNAGGASQHGSGLASLTMRYHRPSMPFPGHIQAQVQSSILPTLIRTGIYMSVNSHYDLGSKSNKLSTNLLMKIGEDEWTKSIDKADMIIDQIQELVVKEKEKALGATQ